MLPRVVAGEKRYAGYTDINNAGYEGVKATIEVVPTAVGSLGVSVWCGIDDGAPFPLKIWIQSGWLRDAGFPSPRGYYEYHKEFTAESGTKIFIAGPVAGLYEVERVYDLVVIRGSGVVWGTLYWSDFDADNSNHKMCRAQYGAEIHDDPSDHVPGDPYYGNCDFTNVYTRAVGGGYSFAWLGQEICASIDWPFNCPLCYVINKTGNSFSFRDKRLLNETTCPSP